MTRTDNQKKVVIYSKAYQEWKNNILQILNQYKYKKKIAYPIILECHFYVKDLRIRDISALYEGIQDCMVSAQILVDDNCQIVIGHDGSRVFLDRKNPRTEVSIYLATIKEKYMTMIQSFKCDGCNEMFTARNEKGEARAIGGIQGGYKDYQSSPTLGDGPVKVIDADFCEVCFAKIIQFVFSLAENNKQ